MCVLQGIQEGEVRPPLKLQLGVKLSRANGEVADMEGTNR